MQIIATIPPPYMADKLEAIVSNPNIDAVRFNTGARSHVSPYATLELLLEAAGDKQFWLDLKGRQLRISQWAIPTYGDIVLNHPIEVDLPAQLIFRDGDVTNIVSACGYKLYVDPQPRHAVGDGQSVNIRSENLKVNGYLTNEDYKYVHAAAELGVKNIMLSFVEQSGDYAYVLDQIPDANLVLKIESKKGLQWANENFQYEKHHGLNANLMVARDDLMTNLEYPEQIIDATQSLLLLDSDAIVASRILTSLEKSDFPSLGDLSDLYLLQLLDVKRIMLGDSLCFNTEGFRQAADLLAKLDEESGWR